MTHDKPYYDEDGDYVFPTGQAFDAYIRDVAEQIIEETLNEYDPDASDDGYSVRDLANERVWEFVDNEQLIIYNHPREWGAVLMYADHADTRDWGHLIDDADSPLDTLRILAFTCVEADVRFEVHKLLDDYENPQPA